MLSRVADSVYWMSRYIERAENVARFIEVNLQLMLDTPTSGAGQWEPLVTTTGDHKLFKELYGQFTAENVIDFLTFSRKYPNSIISCLTAARENARGARDTISSDIWEQINRFYLMVRDPTARQRAADNPYDFFSSIRMASHLVAGVTDATMAHNEAWNFARVARLMERADKTSRILDVKYFILLPQAEYVGTPYDNIHWSALLKSASALEMYRKKFPAIAPAHVAEFLVLEREFPRAVRYCIANAEESLRAITGSPPGTFYNSAEMLMGRLRSDLDYVRITEIINTGLHEYLDDLQTRLNDLDDAVSSTFFGQTPLPPVTETAQPVGAGSQSQTQVSYA
jgi:uncharacterized alpha-E superfamily protein